MLELRELVKHYPAVGGEPVRAVDGVSLAVEPGEMVALYGPSGSGKTTLLLMVATLLAPTSGAVLIGGRDVSSLSEREASHFRLSELGFVRQNFDLLPGVTAIDNAVLKLLKTMRWRDAQSGRAAAGSPGSRGTPGAPRGEALDGRAPARDDRAGSVDRTAPVARGRADGQPGLSARAGSARTAARAVPRARVAIVLVSHDPQAAAYADRVYALRDGKLGEYEPDRHRRLASAPELPRASGERAGARQR